MDLLLKYSEVPGLVKFQSQKYSFSQNKDSKSGEVKTIKAMKRQSSP